MSMHSGGRGILWEAIFNPGTPGIDRTAQSKLTDVVSVLDYGAACDGVTDDSSAVTAAIATGKPVVTPDTVTKTTGALGTIPAGSVIINGALVGIGGGVSLSVANTWTASQTFNGSTGAGSPAVVGNGSGSNNAGASFTGAGAGVGVAGTGGATNGIGGNFAGGGAAGRGGVGTGAGSGVGLDGVGDPSGTGPGLRATAGGAPTPTRGALNLAPQATPSSPSDGDLWNDTTSKSASARVNGATVLLGPGPMLDATTAAAQSIPSAAATIVVFGTVVRDTDTAYVAATGRYTIPTGKGGDYIVSAAIRYSGAAGTNPAISIYKGGTVLRSVASQFNSDVGTSIGISATVNLAAGDIIDIRANQASGGAVTLIGQAEFNYFSIKRIP